MPPLPVTAEARGAVRAFKTAVKESSRWFEGALFDAGVADANLYARRGSPVGRARALKRLVERYGRPSLTLPRAVAWTYLKTVGNVILRPSDAGQAQPAVAVSYLAAGRMIENGVYLESGLWTLEVPDHALHRLAQRARGVDLGAVLREAHEQVLRLRLNGWPTGDLLVAAGQGAFVGQLVAGEDVKTGALVVYFRPRTWLHEDQLAPGQDLAPVGESVADEFLPLPLRQLRQVGKHLEIRRIA
jgi:hypothetical protein